MVWWPRTSQAASMAWQSELTFCKVCVCVHFFSDGFDVRKHLKTYWNCNTCSVILQLQAEWTLRQHVRLPGRNQNQPGQSSGQMKNNQKKYLPVFRFEAHSYHLFCINLFIWNFEGPKFATLCALSLFVSSQTRCCARGFVPFLLPTVQFCITQLSDFTVRININPKVKFSWQCHIIVSYIFTFDKKMSSGTCMYKKGIKLV